MKGSTISDTTGATTLRGHRRAGQMQLPVAGGRIGRRDSDLHTGAPIEVDARHYLRIPVRTHVITHADDMLDVARRYVGGMLRPGDLLFVSEKATAITQGRAIPVDSIKPGLLARILWRFVRKVPYGIGLRSPCSMQCAIDECGRLRIFLAAVVGLVGKMVGRRGDFYRIAGIQAAAVDAAETAGIPAYRDCVIKGPLEPECVASRMAAALGVAVAVVDVNDLGATVLGHSEGVDSVLIAKALRDNPLGQGSEQTPLGILRAF